MHNFKAIHKERWMNHMTKWYPDLSYTELENYYYKSVGMFKIVAASGIVMTAVYFARKQK